MNQFLELQHICKSFTQGQARVTVLDDINFRFNFKHSYAITGSSGAGKSTLINIIAGAQQPDFGIVNWSDQFVINQLSLEQKSQFWNQKIGLILQQPSLIQELTVLENVVIKGMIGNIPNIYAQAAELLDRLGLKDRVNFFPALLSRGEQQRVAIARALIGNSGLILADEPTASLDRKNGEIVMDLLIDLAKSYQLGLIISTHDEYAYCKTDRIAHLLDCKLNLTS